MKNLFLFFGTLFFLSQVSFAADSSTAAGDKKAEQKEENFQKHKEETLKHLDQMLEVAQKTKACVTSAKNKEEMKACHETHMKAMKSFESMHREHKAEKIDAQIKRLQEEKAHLKDSAPASGN